MPPAPVPGGSPPCLPWRANGPGPGSKAWREWGRRPGRQEEDDQGPAEHLGHQGDDEGDEGALGLPDVLGRPAKGQQRRKASTMAILIRMRPVRPKVRPIHLTVIGAP